MCVLFLPLTLVFTIDLFSNFSWVVIPLWLMWDSYGHIAGSLRQAQTSARAKKN
jgi:hypothetical protein